VLVGKVGFISGEVSCMVGLNDGVLDTDKVVGPLGVGVDDIAVLRSGIVMVGGLAIVGD
jgi:hypothetical protein